MLRRVHLPQSGRLGDGFGLGVRVGGRVGGEACLTDLADVLVELVVVPPENMILELNMLLIAAEVLPADLAVVRGRHGRFHGFWIGGRGEVFLS